MPERWRRPERQSISTTTTSTASLDPMADVPRLHTETWDEILLRFTVAAGHSRYAAGNQHRAAALSSASLASSTFRTITQPLMFKTLRLIPRHPFFSDRIESILLLLRTRPEVRQWTSEVVVEEGGYRGVAWQRLRAPGADACSPRAWNEVHDVLQLMNSLKDIQIKSIHESHGGPLLVSAAAQPQARLRWHI